MHNGDQALAIRVFGRVQGVGFRFFVQRHAVALQLNGWVKNETDGSVLLHVLGPDGDVRRLRDKLMEGPRFSRVDHLEESPLAAEPAAAARHSFTIAY